MIFCNVVSSFCGDVVNYSFTFSVLRVKKYLISINKSSQYLHVQVAIPSQVMSNIRPLIYCFLASDWLKTNGSERIIYEGVNPAVCPFHNYEYINDKT